MYTEISQCRLCGNRQLTTVLSLGDQYLATSFVKTNKGNPLAKIKVPLTLVLCDPAKNPKACGLVQLRETVERDVMYREYFYRSHTNPMMRDALKEIVDEATRRVELTANDAVLDIGCNDGTLLTFYPDSVRRFGIDPAANIPIRQADSSIAIAVDYFGASVAAKLSGDARFKIVTSIAMFYDLDDPHGFVRDVKQVLAEDGVWCLQLSYLRDLIEQMNFYDICHEHLLYYSLRALCSLFEAHGLTVVDASTNLVNGGSIRLFVKHEAAGVEQGPAVEQLLKEEKQLGLANAATYREFANRIDALKVSILGYMSDEQQRGGMVSGLGASTKGNVLLQYFGITKENMPFITDRNPDKAGLRTLGTDIEVVPEEHGRKVRPSTQLVLIWFFKDELLKREERYLAEGGKLLFPMPSPHLVGASGEYALPAPSSLSQTAVARS
ncbi:MAG: class I SAM-dependent methyltransferase [Candidatus Solibacter sp.]